MTSDKEFFDYYTTAITFGAIESPKYWKFVGDNVFVEDATGCRFTIKVQNKVIAEKVLQTFKTRSFYDFVEALILSRRLSSDMISLLLRLRPWYQISLLEVALKGRSPKFIRKIVHRAIIEGNIRIVRTYLNRVDDKVSLQSVAVMMGNRDIVALF